MIRNFSLGSCGQGLYMRNSCWISGSCFHSSPHSLPPDGRSCSLRSPLGRNSQLLAVPPFSPPNRHTNQPHGVFLPPNTLFVPHKLSINWRDLTSIALCCRIIPSSEDLGCMFLLLQCSIDDGHGWVVILTPHREREWPRSYLLVYPDRWWRYPDLELLLILGFIHTAGRQ